MRQTLLIIVKIDDKCTLSTDSYEQTENERVNLSELNKSVITNDSILFSIPKLMCLLVFD